MKVVRVTGYVYQGGANTGTTDMPIPYDGTIIGVQLTLSASDSNPAGNIAYTAILWHNAVQTTPITFRGTSQQLPDSIVGHLEIQTFEGFLTSGGGVPFGDSIWIAPYLDVGRGEKLVLAATSGAATGVVEAYATVHLLKSGDARYSTGRQPLTTN